MKRAVVAGAMVLTLAAGVFIGAQTSMVSKAASGESASHLEMHNNHQVLSDKDINKVTLAVQTEQIKRAEAARQAEIAKQEAEKARQAELARQKAAAAKKARTQRVSTTHNVCGVCGRNVSVCGGNHHSYNNSSNSTKKSYNNSGSSSRRSVHHSESGHHSNGGHHGGGHH